MVQYIFTSCICFVWVRHLHRPQPAETIMKTDIMDFNTHIIHKIRFRSFLTPSALLTSLLRPRAATPIYTSAQHLRLPNFRVSVHSPPATWKRKTPDKMTFGQASRLPCCNVNERRSRILISFTDFSQTTATTWERGDFSSDIRIFYWETDLPFFTTL